MKALVGDARFLEELRSRFNAGDRPQFVFFWGHQSSKNGITASCFSQWYNASFVVDGQHYPTAEHFMMAEKAALFGDLEARQQVLHAKNPSTAKALGRQVRGFDEAIWLENRFSIVVRASQAKFMQNPELKQFLKQTGSCVLVEASPVDKVWGIGLAKEDVKASDPNLWLGLNLLGFALMRVREDV
jgi:ribA/ribD-fused uncharacterized protein